MEESAEEPWVIPITDELDLHTFRPQEATQVLAAYFEACRERGIFRVRVIHGKGIGTLRETVHHFLKISKLVLSYSNAENQNGGWGATWVKLKLREDSKSAM